jgi:hypothetical protein
MSYEYNLKIDRSSFRHWFQSVEFPGMVKITDMDLSEVIKIINIISLCLRNKPKILNKIILARMVHSLRVLVFYHNKKLKELNNDKSNR